MDLKKISSYLSEGIGDILAFLDVFLGSTYDWDISKFERVDFSSDDLKRVGSLIHNIDFC